MIIKTFDNGWGDEFPAKQFENFLLSKVYEQLKSDPKTTVVVNSVWYSDFYHTHTVMPYLKANSIDRVVLVSMLDPAIPQADWFQGLAGEVVSVGYYPGAGFVDYWALFLDKHFQEPHIVDMVRADVIDTAFMCLNRKPHWHRVKLYRQLEANNLLDSGLVSLGGDNGPAVRTIAEELDVVNLAPNSGVEQNGIPNDITTLGRIENWQRCFLNVVTETIFDINHNYFVSEKIYKPILGHRPFLVYDTDGATRWLTERGFETYCRDFGDISDLDLTDPDNIVPFLSVLCQQPRTYWQKKFLDLIEKMLYNKRQFDVYANSQQKLINEGLPCLI